MNMVQKIHPILSIIGLGMGQETAVETRPLLPLTPSPGRDIARIIDRVKWRDGNVTVFEREYIYATEQKPVEPTPPPPQPKTKGPVYYRREFRYHYQSNGRYWLDDQNNPAPTAAVDEVYEAARDGRLVIIDMIPNVPWLPHERELWNMNEAAKRRTDRIVLQGGE